jgi:S1-C subfamily serine protease
MKNTILITIVTLLIGFGISAGTIRAIDNEPMSDVQLIEYGMRSIVTVECEGYVRGTAFYIGAGLFVTAAHLPEGLELEHTTLTFEDGTTLRVLESFICEDYDVAFYRTEPVDKPSLRFDQTQLMRGETVYVLGNPVGIPFLASKGIVRGWDKESTHFGDVVLVVVDASTYAGNSGSPLLDSEGEVRAVYVGGKVHRCGSHISTLGVCILTSDIQRAMLDLGL